MARAKRTSRTSARTTGTRGRVNGLKARALATFGALLEQGAALRRKGGRIILAKAREAREAVAFSTELARARTAGAVSRLEKAFEQRVGRAVSRLGVPAASDVRALSRQVAQLQQSVNQLRRSRARA